MKRDVSYWEKVFAKHIFQKWLILKYREVLNSTEISTIRADIVHI